MKTTRCVVAAVLAMAWATAAWAGPRTATVYTLAVGGRPPVGSASPSVLKYDALEGKGAWADRVLELAVSENLPAGAGAQMRQALWLAAAVAGQTAADPMFDRNFSVSVKGMVDGPSAGALFTVAMLALMQGDEIKPNITMTGTVLPDGSVGMVGEIRYKMEGAKRAGMTKVLLPDCARVEADSETGQIVDLAEHGKRLGLEVVFVGSVRDAYSEFTGKPLKAFNAQPARDGQVALPAEMDKAIRNSALERFNEFQAIVLSTLTNGALDNFKFQSSQAREAAGIVLEKALRHELVNVAEGLSLLQEGNWVAGYEKVTKAWLMAKAVAAWQAAGFKTWPMAELQPRMHKCLERMEEVRQTAADAKGMDDVERAMIRSRFTHDALDVISLVDNLGNVAEALNQQYAEIASRPTPWIDKLVSAPDKAQMEAHAAVTRARNTMVFHLLNVAQATFRSRAGSLTNPDLFADSFSFRGGGGPKPLKPESVEKWGLFTGIGYKAVSDVLGAALQAQAQDEQTARAMALDPAISRAVILDQIMAAASQKPADTNAKGDGPVKTKETTADTFEALLVFAQQQVEIMAFLTFRELCPMDHDKDGETDAFLFGGALKAMLDRAAANAKQAILQAEGSGYTAMGARYDYLLAEGLRDGRPDDRFKALRLYWSASTMCRLLDLCVSE